MINLNFVVVVVLESTLYPYLLPGRHANLLKHLFCIGQGPLNETLKKCEDANLLGILEKETTKLDP